MSVRQTETTALVGVLTKELGPGLRVCPSHLCSLASTFPVALVCIISSDSSNRYSNQILWRLLARNQLQHSH